MPFAILLAALLAPSTPPLDDSAEAYRIDAIRTKALNDAALDRLAPAIDRPVPIAAPRAPTAAEIDLAARERRAIDAWRARAAQCRAGTRSACD